MILCDHQAHWKCVTAAIIHNGGVIAQDTPSNLINNVNAKDLLRLIHLLLINMKNILNINSKIKPFDKITTEGDKVFQ